MGHDAVASAEISPGEIPETKYREFLENAVRAVNACPLSHKLLLIY
jgi:hypothetical protein